MNKYQRAYNLIDGDVLFHSIALDDDDERFKELLEALGILNELVDKATPKRLDSLYYKIRKEYDEYYVRGRCLTCGNEFTVSKENRPNYCSNCGQKLDWGEDE